MTREELLADIDAAVSAFAEEIASRDIQSSGIPKPPSIVTTETSLDHEPFNFKLDESPESSAEVLEGGGGVPLPPPEEPPNCVFTATLSCDSVSNSRSKCGFSPYSGGGPNKYLTETISRFVKQPACCTTPGNATCSADIDGTQTITQTVNPFTCTTSSVRDKVTATNCDGSTGEIDATACGSMTIDGPTSQSCDQTDNPWCSVSCPPQFGATNERHRTETRTLSDLYPTSTLISVTEALLPAFDGIFGDICSSLRDLSADETSYSIRRVQYKFVLDPPATVHCTLRWAVNTYDESHVLLATEPAATFISPGMVETPIFTLNEPASDGTKEIAYPI